jgi:hypothetical protein
MTSDEEDDDLLPAAVAKAQLLAEIACVKREVKLRESLYPRRVEADKMTRTSADKEIALMKAVLARLEALPR